MNNILFGKVKDEEISLFTNKKQKMFDLNDFAFA